MKLQTFKISKALKKELYRKALHLSSLWIPLFIYLVHPGISIIFFSALFVANAVIEYGNYKKYPWARQTFGSVFFRILHVSDKRPEYGEGIWYGKIITDKSAHL